jgi:hypothetical protein
MGPSRKGSRPAGYHGLPSEASGSYTMMREQLNWREVSRMKRLVFFTLTISMLAVSAASLAQTPAQPAPDTSAPAADTAPAAKMPARAKPAPNPGEVLRRTTCRQNADQSLKGPDFADAVLICMAEARLNCLKQAVSDKVRGKQREAFMSTCSGS